MPSANIIEKRRFDQNEFTAAAAIERLNSTSVTFDQNTSGRTLSASSGATIVSPGLISGPRARLI